jgi:hypothetical protein
MASSPKTNPNIPPRNASRTLSVNSCRTSRPWAAPRAERSVNSRRRPNERARRRLATLAQAISNTTPTAPSRIRSGRRVSPATCVASGVILDVNQPASACGNCFSCSFAKRSNSAWDWLNETPNLRRATTASSSGAVRSGEMSVMAGTHISGSRGNWKLPGISSPRGNAKPSGITPTTAKDSPFNSIFRPTTFEFPPNFLCQSL